jgi:hypothetical protein
MEREFVETLRPTGLPRREERRERQLSTDMQARSKEITDGIRSADIGTSMNSPLNFGD